MDSHDIRITKKAIEDVIRENCHYYLLVLFQSRWKGLPKDLKKLIWEWISGDLRKALKMINNKMINLF